MNALPAHAPLSPSAASRWINCPGSIKTVTDGQIPPQPSSPYAEEGSRAHALFAQCLLEGRNAKALTDDPLLAAPLQEALDHARLIIAGRSVLIEQRLPPLPGLPDLWGTADIAVFDRDLHLSDVIDLKYGTFPVEADTVQTGIYGLLAAGRFGLSAEGLTTWIIQPRCAHSQGPVRSYRYDVAALRVLLETVRTAATEVHHPAAPTRAGTWCRFCPAARICPEQRALQRRREPSLWSRSAE
jgi:hypothetical protein